MSRKSWHCQFCDKEMFFEASIKEIQGYITCGGSSCKRRAVKSYDGILTDAVIKDRNQRAKEKEEQEGGMVAELIVVFKTQSPEINDSWKLVAPEDHPAFLKDPNVMQKMIDEEVQAQDSDDPSWWYHVKTVSDTREALEQHKEDSRVH